MVNMFDAFFDAVDKSIKATVSAQKLAIVLKILELCVQYNKEPREIITILKKVIRELKNQNLSID